MDLDTVFPGGPAMWLVKQIGKWLLAHCTQESRWKYQTSSGGSVSGGPIAQGAGTGGEIWFKRDAQIVKLTFLMGGAGLSLTPPLMVEFSVPAFPSRGALWLTPGSKDFDSATDFGVPGLGALGPCAALVFDAKVLVGYQASVFLFGTHSAIVRALKDLAQRVKKVEAIMTEERPSGFVKVVSEELKRPFRVGYNALAAYVDIVSIFVRLNDATKSFRAMLFMEASELSFSLPAGIGIGGGITAYLGGVHAANVEKLP